MSLRMFEFMGRMAHPTKLPPGVLYIGEPGSGKTATILCHIRAMAEMGIPLIGVDLKGDLPPFLRHVLGDFIPVHEIDPFHKGGARIDWGAMMKNEVSIDAFVKKIIPEIKGDSQPHFRNSAVKFTKLAASLLNHYAKDKWYLADLIRLAKNRRMLIHLNNQTAGKFPRIELDREDQGSTKDVQSTIETSLSLFEIYAALELRCEKAVNPFDVVDLGMGHVVMLWSDEFETVLSSVYSFVIDAVTTRLLSRQTNQPTMIWLDELSSLQKIKAIDATARRGRSSGVIMLVGVQTFEGVKEIYGENVAEQMLSLLPFKIFLRAGSVKTAKWAAEYLGIPRVLEIIWIPKDGVPDQRTVKDNHHMVTPEELRRIPRPNLNKEDVIHGFLDFPDGSGPFEIDVLSNITHPKGAPKKPVPDEWQHLPPHTADDLVRLRLPNCANFI